ncbi:hypothetical protein HU200_003284 [Digitaria exilis]|uniref:Uncharacterized protein n=1 Tax=Digitaria exilis TaxID=1010633 RepID=A0A835FU72_9POAL|nr:hypothetical protein HU200_003284 [Digitaria exilis]
MAARQRREVEETAEDVLEGLDEYDLSKRPEVRIINRYVRIRTWVMLVFKAVGSLALLWLTVVLLGGFVTSLEQRARCEDLGASRQRPHHQDEPQIPGSNKQQSDKRRFQAALLSLYATIRATWTDNEVGDFASLIAELVASNDFAGKIKAMIKENSHATPACVSMLKIICKMVILLAQHGHYVQDFKDKKIMDALSEASKTMASLEGCMLFAGMDVDSYGVPLKPVSSVLVEEARQLLDGQTTGAGLIRLSELAQSRRPLSIRIRDRSRGGSSGITIFASPPQAGLSVDHRLVAEHNLPLPGYPYILTLSPTGQDKQIPKQWPTTMKNTADQPVETLVAFARSRRHQGDVKAYHQSCPSGLGVVVLLGEVVLLGQRSSGGASCS